MWTYSYIDIMCLPESKLGVADNMLTWMTTSTNPAERHITWYRHAQALPPPIPIAECFIVAEAVAIVPTVPTAVFETETFSNLVSEEDGDRPALTAEQDMSESDDVPASGQPGVEVAERDMSESDDEPASAQPGVEVRRAVPTFGEMDMDGDGVISAAEFEFARMDTNRDGEISASEFLAAQQH